MMWWLRGIALGAGLALGVPPTLAAERGGAPPTSPVRDQKTILVPIGKSRIVDLSFAAARVSVANPAIADTLVINPRQIYVVGKELGSTNMVFWGEADRVQDMMSLEVTHDVQALKEKIFRLLPGEKIGVESAQGAIVLTGTVSSAPKMAAALRLAEQYASETKTSARVGLPGGGQANVINLLQVGGAQQVLLEVKVAEIARDLGRTLDIDFASMYDGGSIRIGSVNGGATFPDYIGRSGLQIPAFPLGKGGIGGPALMEFNPLPGAIANTGAFANLLRGNFFFNVVLDIAKTEGLAKILAEPNLTTLSGKEAEFLSGGEFPVPVPQGNNGQISIEYKKFGIALKFLPVVLDSGLISLQVNVSVSELSNDAGLALQPTQSSASLAIPSLKTRGANATVEVPSGQTLAIAGLLNESLAEGVKSFPGLGQLPLVGSLFRDQDFKKKQTELMIFVTPRLARPFDPALTKLPTDRFVEPSDVEFYLMGRLEARPPGARGALGTDPAGTEGHFGHDL